MMKTGATYSLSPTTRRGYSLVEILAAMAIFLIGIVSILTFFPNIIRAQNESLLRDAATMRAQEKIMEIRRDVDADPSGQSLIDAIRNRATPTDAVILPRDPRLAYAFNGRSLLDPVDDADNPDDDFDVARVIILKADGATSLTALGAENWKIMAEMRFDTGI